MDRMLLWDLLGVRPGAVEVARHPPDLTLATPSGLVPCSTLIPDRPRGTIIYAHAHGLRFDIGGDEIRQGRNSLQDPPLGQALFDAGFAVIAPDLPGHGRRQPEGPESALAKAAHWNGETLFGHMIRDLCACIDVLPELKLTGPLGCVGFSMGSFLTLWLAALRPDVSACAHLCGVTSLSELVPTGAHDLHAPYLTVPGFLNVTDLPQIAASIAPRPQFIAAGLQDPLTPPQTLAPLLAELRAAYPSGGLVAEVDPDAGHEETPAVRVALLEFFDRALS